MSIVLLAVLAITVLVSLVAFTDENLREKCIFEIRKIRNGEQYRMLSSGFVHGDIFHLFFNMYALYLFGNQFIYFSSPLFFAIIYFSGLAVGSLLTVFIHQNDLYYRALGASGAVSAVVFGTVIFDPQLEIMIFPIPIGIPAYIFGLLFLLYSLYGMKAGNDNIGHTAHLGGAVAGYAFTAIVYFETFSSNFPFSAIPAAAFLFLGLYRYGFKK